MERLRARQGEIMSSRRRAPTERKPPHKHTDSRTQWEFQVRAILNNITMLEKEYSIYRGLNNDTMTRGILKNLITRRAQLKKFLSEKPPADRPHDIRNNKWAWEVEALD